MPAKKKQEKERKLKIICLILICLAEIARRSKGMSIPEVVIHATECVYWGIEYYKVKHTPVIHKPMPEFATGGVVHGNNEKISIYENNETRIKILKASGRRTIVELPNGKWIKWTKLKNE